jgi:type II secretory pathway component GspD/PulD (secretin)
MLGISRRTLIACSILALLVPAISAGAVENEINGVNVVPLDGKVRIEIGTAGNVTFDAFTMNEPDRLVINCIGAKYNVPWQVKEVRSPLASKVRTSQFQLDPALISRVVVDLSTAVDYRMWAENGMQVVELTRRAPEALRADVQESSALMQSMSEPAPAPAKAPAKDPANAPRIEPDAASSVIAQASMSPFLPYVPTLAASATAKPETAKSSGEAVQKSAPEIESPAPAQPESSAKPEPSAQLEPPAKAESPAQPGSPWVASEKATGETSTATASSDNFNFYATEDDAYSPLSETDDAKPAATPWTESYARGNPPAGGGRGMGSNRITIDAQGADIKTVLRTISDYSGKNIVYGPDVKGEVYVHIKDVPWEEALDILLRAHGFGYREEFGMIRVSEMQRLTKEELEMQTAERKKDDLLPLVTRIIFVNNSSAEELKTALQNIVSQRGKMDVDQGSNALIVNDTEPVIDKIAEMVKSLDKKTFQVDINAKLVEVDVEATRELGINWSLLNLHASGLSGIGSAEFNNSIPLSAGTVKFGTVRSWGELNAVLEMLERSNKANIISNPRITTMDNREARILVGKEIPLIVADEAGNPITELTKIGIMLKVTPHVNSDRTITLDMHPEVSELQSEATAQGGIIISTSEADTRVVVQNGATAVIGGLIKGVDTNTRTGVPLLKDIPFLGRIFSSSSNSNKKQELVIFVTPTIVE